MRSKVTLVLIFLNVVLFFFIFHFERDWRTERSSLEARRRVLGAEAADIRVLEVVSAPPGSSFRLERRGDDWFLTKPFEWPANFNAVSRILNELQFMEHVTSFSTRDLAKNGQSLADYGLDPNRPKFTVSFTSGEPSASRASAPLATVLRIGDTTRVDNNLYLLSPDGAQIHVVSRTLVDSLSLPLDELRADVLFKIPVYEASALDLQTTAPSGLHVYIRKEGNRWEFKTPGLALANKTQTELAIKSLDSLRVKSFVQPNGLAVLPSAAPVLSIRLSGNNRDETLFVGAETGPDHDHLAQLKDRSPVFTVAIPKPLMDQLKNARDELRDRHVLDFDPHAVTAITLSTPGQPELALQRLEASASPEDGANWQIALRGSGAQGPQMIQADRAAVERLLEELSRLSAVEFKSDSPTDSDIEDWGFKSPVREVALTLGGATPSQTTLLIGRPTVRGPYDYAKVAGTLPVFAVDPDILRETSVSVLDWRDRQLRKLSTSARITALTLTNLADNTVVYSRKLADAETWESALANEAAPRQEAIKALRDQIMTLRAKAFVQDSFPDKIQVGGDLRPWHYRLDASASLPGSAAGAQTEVTTLWFTDRTGGAEQLAGSKQFGPLVFEIEQPFVDALWTLTYGARDPGPPPAKAP